MSSEEYESVAFYEHLQIEMRDPRAYPLCRFTLSFSPPTDKAAKEIKGVIKELGCFDITERLDESTIGSYSVCCPEEQASQHLDRLKKRLAQFVGLECRIKYEIMHGVNRD